MSLPGALLPWVELGFLLADGTPNAGGFVYFYEAGTSTPQDTFFDQDLAPGHENTNPIELEDDGRPPNRVFILPTGYKVIVQDSSHAALYDYDDVSDPSFTFFSTVANVWAQGSKSVTSGYEVTNDDNLVTVDEPSVDPASVTLQLAADRGGVLFVQNAGTTAVNISPRGTETINGVNAAFQLPAQSGSVYPSVMLLSDGVSGYFVVGGWGLV